MIKFLHRDRTLLSAFLFLGAASDAVAVRAGEWPSFRVPDLPAVSDETGLLKVWPAQGPPLVWETKGAGRGYASLAIDANRIYTLGDAPSTASDDEEYI